MLSSSSSFIYLFVREIYAKQTIHEDTKGNAKKNMSKAERDEQEDWLSVDIEG